MMWIIGYIYLKKEMTFLRKYLGNVNIQKSFYGINYITDTRLLKLSI